MNRRTIALTAGAVFLILSLVNAVLRLLSANGPSLWTIFGFALVGYVNYAVGIASSAQRGRHSGDSQPWNLGEAIGVAWKSFGAAPLKLTVATLFFLVPGLVALGLTGYGSARAVVGQVQRFGSMGGSATSPAALVQAAMHDKLVVVGAVLLIVTFVLRPVLAGGMLAVFTRSARDAAPRVTDFAAALHPARLLSLIASEWLIALPLAAPTILVDCVAYSMKSPSADLIAAAGGLLTALALNFILPGFALTFFFVVDKGLGPVEALAASWGSTRGHRVSIWLYMLAAIPALLIGLMAFGIGALFTVLLYNVGFAYVCTRIAGRTERPLFSPEWGANYLRNFLRTTFAVNLFAFAIACIAILRQPLQRNIGWSIGNTLSRVAAVLLGVTLTLSLLAAMLPAILDLLERRGFSSFVGARHVRSQKSGFLTVISVLAIGGVAVSSCSLSSVSSIMGGFSADLKRKILGNNAHIVIDQESRAAWEGWEPVVERARGVPGVSGATPVVQGEVMVQSASNLAGVIVRGVEAESIGKVIDIERNIEVGKFGYLVDPDRLRRLPSDEVVGLGKHGERFLKGKDILPLPDDLDPSVREAVALKPLYPGVVIGRELAKTLHVYVGDDLTLVSPLGDLGPMGILPRMKKFRVAAIFYSGMYEYDASHVYIDIGVAQDYFGIPGKVHFVDIRTDNVQTTDATTPRVRDAIPRPELRVRDWREINRNLFSALKLERFAMFLILSIAIMVASFCIVCTLLLMVTEKGKEIAILKAMGASDVAIQRTFMGEGVIIGAIGTAFGVTMALALCLGLKWFGLPLNPEVYYIDKLPVNVDAGDFFLVTIAALTICTLSTIYPARAASRIRPVDGLRYE